MMLIALYPELTYTDRMSLYWHHKYLSAARLWGLAFAISFWGLAGCRLHTQKLPEGFVYLSDYAPTIVQDMRYATAYNFTGDLIPGYDDGVCILTRPAAQALAAVQTELHDRGYTLKVFDCYRPQRAVDAFVAWAEGADTVMKPIFYPGIDKSQLFPDGYIAARSGHSRGSTLDLTISTLENAQANDRATISCRLAAGDAGPNGQLDFGTAFDCFDTLSHTADPRITPLQAENRTFLVSIMASHGFQNYPKEWWHFTYQPEPFPDQYFDFPVE